MSSPVVPVILSGGQGVRLWPLSRAMKPKQFIPLLAGQSLFEQALLRVGGPSGFKDPLVVCAQDHRFLVKNLISNKYKVQKVVTEPCGRNTAPALCVAALYAQQQYSRDDPLLLVLPSDHYIDNTEQFLNAVERAIPLAEEGFIVTFGVEPRNAHTGFGYIERGDVLGAGFHINKFHEKPDSVSAGRYVEQGGFYWNAGIYLVRASVYLDELSLRRPDVHRCVVEAYSRSAEGENDVFLDEEKFSSVPDVSIDRAVMECTDRGCVLPVSFRWDDFGSWDALWEVSTKDDTQNVVRGDVVAVDTHNSYLHTDGLLLCAVGVENIIAVVEQGAVFIGARESSEKMRELVAQLKTANRSELVQAQDIYRPWGYYRVLSEDVSSVVRRLRLDPHARLPLQIHDQCSEHWVVVHGAACVVMGDQELEICAGQSVNIPAGIAHFVENRTDAVLEVLEVQTGLHTNDGS